MSKNSTIDTIFKTGLEGQGFDNAEALWQRMEPQLQQQQKKRDRKKYVLLLLLVAAGSAVTTYLLTTKSNTNRATAENRPADRPASSANTAPVTDYTYNTPGNNSNTATQPTNTGGTPSASGTTFLLTAGDMGNGSNANRPLITGNSRAATRVRITNAPATGVDEAVVTTVSDAQTATPLVTPEETELNSNADKDVVAQINMEPVAAEQKKETTTATVKSNKENTDKTALHKTPAAEKRKKVLNPLPDKVQIELAAGIDPFRELNNGGSYALVLMRIPLNNKANVLLGAGYNKHSMSESYKIAGKESTLTRDADARVQGLTMLQFPILYEQPIPKSRFIARIGVTPVYIMEANVVNVANTFNGSVIPFRSFTLDDVNRFSVLFTPALQYRLTNKLSAEVRGNYGLTGLVKNSYINQSSENNNFKSLQIGVMFRLGKK